MNRSHAVSPSLEYYRKQAKALLKAQGAGDPMALARFQQHHPRLAGASPQRLGSTPLRLADAQLVLAREHGFPSWPRFQTSVRDEAARQLQTGAMDASPDPVSRSSLLIVDDEPDFRDTLVDIFTNMGFEAVAVATAQEALEHLGSRFFNVALIDYRLPDMRGTELLERSKSIHRDLIGIIITGYASVDSALKAIRARTFWYFEKPVDLEKLTEVILQGLNEQEETMLARRLLSEARGSER